VYPVNTDHVEVPIFPDFGLDFPIISQFPYITFPDFMQIRQFDVAKLQLSHGPSLVSPNGLGQEPENPSFNLIKLSLRNFLKINNTY